MRTIVAVVDADGRLAPDAPVRVATWFAERDVGGVQVRVRIYNRHRLLTWFQDVEFGVYGMLYQAARARLGTSGMGGNGQFTRLAALDGAAIQLRGEPWRDRLTEDQDLGLVLLESGWRCGHDNRTSVDQQGLPEFRALFRQRTRWSQGNLQAMGHLGHVRDIPRSGWARADLVLYLAQPIMQALVGLALATAFIAWAMGDAPFLPENGIAFLVFYMFGFGGVILGCIARSGRGPINWIRGWLIAMVYAAYTWLLWPVLLRSTWRQLTANQSWAKTAREDLPEADPGAHGPSATGAVSSGDRTPV